MIRTGVVHNNRIRRLRFMLSLFLTYIGVLFLMSGIHTGLLVLMEKLQCQDLVQIFVTIAYWGIVALGITLFAVSRIREAYEKPMQALAKATAKVAAGDFSVYVPTMHTADKMDYIDVMIMDFNKMVEELGSIETLKTDFVSNVSHEMKTPISVIKNYAELLGADEIRDAKRKEYAESIEYAASKLSNLITNILKLNKLENQKLTPEVKIYDVCRQLCECILPFEDAWEEKEIELEIEMEDAAMIRADQSLMELVWNNLMSNAIKFTEAGGCIRVIQTSEENHIQVVVSDTGCGISRESMKHIFDKFYQGDTSHSREGNGLGMALVKRVLELMDGEIQVISEEGKGSTFTITLPTADVKEIKGGIGK